MRILDYYIIILTITTKTQIDNGLQLLGK